MAITINGSGTITGISAGGYPDATVTAADLASSLDLTGKTVTLPSGTGGKILQVQQTVKRDIASQLFSATNTYQDISGMAVNITPVAADSNILVMYNIHVSQSSSATVHIRLALGSDDTIFIGDQNTVGANPLRDTGMFRPSGSPYVLNIGNINMSFLDDPTYTLGNSLTYKLRWTLGSSYTATAYLNRASSASNSDYNPTVPSSITVMEIAG